MTDKLLFLRDLIHERTGLFFRDGDGLETISKRLKPLAEKCGCHSLTEYFQILNRDGAQAEWQNVVAALAKHASTFFRHRNHTHVLAESIVPRLISDGESLKIWSAGCSTGEEPIMIAIALNEAGWFDRSKIEIVATDGSVKAIEKARSGIYSDANTTGMNPELRERYFDHDEAGWKVKRSLHDRIRWSVANIASEDDIAELAAADIIYCRNVFIYFSEVATVRTLRSFAKHMRNDGYLFTDEGDYFDQLVAGTGLFGSEKLDGITVRRCGA